MWCEKFNENRYKERSQNAVMLRATDSWHLCCADSHFIAMVIPFEVSSKAQETVQHRGCNNISKSYVIYEIWAGAGEQLSTEPESV
jgi:hypothetical protein